MNIGVSRISVVQFVWLIHLVISFAAVKSRREELIRQEEKEERCRKEKEEKEERRSKEQEEKGKRR